MTIQGGGEGVLARDCITWPAPHAECERRSYLSQETMKRITKSTHTNSILGKQSPKIIFAFLSSGAVAGRGYEVCACLIFVFRLKDRKTQLYANLKEVNN